MKTFHVKHYSIVIFGLLVSGCGGSNAPQCAGPIINTWKLSGGDTVQMNSACEFTEIACAQKGTVSELGPNTLTLQIESQGEPLSASCGGPGMLSCTYVISGTQLAFNCRRES